jgi:hypothetical protein
VWLDLNNKKCHVPKIEGRIIMKVTRKHKDEEQQEEESAV